MAQTNNNHSQNNDKQQEVRQQTQVAGADTALNKQSNNKPTKKYKHVNVQRKRPQLTRDGVGGAKEAIKANRQASRPHASNVPNPNSRLKVIPLGGLDAIGKNMTVFECNGDLIIDDAGLMFPDDNHPGVDLVLPDYTYVLKNAHKLRGIVLTHGHEDHTGCLP
ncbi:MAG: ribonuclease J, partial [Eggerthellaceae bacterium]|nr:ribonuclease J [Eggerthellaceae bacterium]